MKMGRNTTYALKQLTIQDGRPEYALLQRTPSENGFMNDAYGIEYEAFPAWLQMCVDSAQGKNLSEGYVPQTTYWFYVDGQPVGRAKLRRTLTDALLAQGGHIGYGIAPECRGKGYATQLLRLVLQEARTQGIERALVTVDEDNTASRRVAEKCGGVLEDIRQGTARYWIDTKKNA